MAETIRFRGARIVNFDVRQGQVKKASATFTRIHFRADFSDVVREAMGWDPRAEGHGGGALIGELVGVKMFVEPSSRELSKYKFEIAIRIAKDFKLIVLNQGKENEEEEISFTVESQNAGAWKDCGRWVDEIGGEKALVVISYKDEPDAKQLKLAEAPKK